MKIICAFDASSKSGGILTHPSEGVEALHEYHKAIGGKPDGTAGTGKKRGRKSAANTEISAPVAAKRMKKEKVWAPPAGSWEDEVDHVDTVEQRLNPKTGQQEKYGYLVWKHRSDEGTQTKTQHPLQLIFKKCPQRVCSPPSVSFASRC